ncbi:unnamed protein product, partial [Cylicostephanus goldi]
MTTYRMQRDLPYSQIPIALDNNQNYKRALNGITAAPRVINGKKNAEQKPIKANSSIDIHSARRRTVIQASTSELLRGLGEFIAQNSDIAAFEPAH